MLLSQLLPCAHYRGDFALEAIGMSCFSKEEFPGAHQGPGRELCTNNERLICKGSRYKLEAHPMCWCCQTYQGNAEIANITKIIGLECALHVGGFSAQTPDPVKSRPRKEYHSTNGLRYGSIMAVISAGAGCMKHDHDAAAGHDRSGLRRIAH